MSKDIDSKPFYDSLTAIMTEAFKFAKAGKNKSGTGAITGTIAEVDILRCRRAGLTQVIKL